MKRCKRYFVFCLFCLFTGIILPAHADTNQETPAEVVSLAFAVSLENTPPVIAKEAKAPSASPFRTGWVSMDSGTRPAYVGIHGGTAPLSLFRASNGMLFAITGQTGNDFIHILRGGTVNGSAGQPLVHKPGEDAWSMVHGITPSGAQKTEKPKEKTVAVKDAGPTAAHAAVARQTPRKTAISEAPAQNQGGAAQANKKNPVPARQIKADAGTAEARPETSPSWKAGTPAMDETPENDSALSAPAGNLDAIMASLPKDHPSLIFASGELASSINDAQALLAPFGFPLPGESAAETAKSSPAAAPRFTPVKLGDYRKILARAGNV